jgi:hypothetical protein
MDRRGRLAEGEEFDSWLRQELRRSLAGVTPAQGSEAPGRYRAAGAARRTLSPLATAFIVALVVLALGTGAVLAAGGATLLNRETHGARVSSAAGTLCPVGAGDAHGVCVSQVARDNPGHAKQSSGALGAAGEGGRGKNRKEGLGADHAAPGPGSTDPPGQARGSGSGGRSCPGGSARGECGSQSGAPKPGGGGHR